VALGNPLGAPGFGMSPLLLERRAMTDESKSGAEGLFPADYANKGWTFAMGMTYTRLTATEVVLEWTVSEIHYQPYGIVHGGVYAGAIETACSMGAAAAAGPGVEVMGVENQTSFLRAVRSGKLTVRATPVQVGRRLQLWEARVTDEQDRIIASGKVRIFCERKG
jgi:1,4-dihydroxy-2-naphthoyl-CoA hydrolase